VVADREPSSEGQDLVGGTSPILDDFVIARDGPW
jgi:hypothetical protein